MGKVISRRKFITVICAITAVCFVLLSAAAAYICVLNKKYYKLQKIDSLVKANYYGRIDGEAINDALCEGYISGLGDKYSYYKGVKDTKETSNNMAGRTEGIGLYTTKHPDNGNIFIIDVMNNSPAQAAGILKHDLITAVDGVSVPEIGYAKAMKSLAGEVGKTVTLTLARGKEIFKRKITYALFETQNVYYSIIGDCGYMRIISFDDATPGQFKAALKALIGKNVKGLIFDLQNNSGGTFDSMCEILDMLVGKGELITLEYADGSTEVAYTSDNKEIKLPMAVLVNSGTASAAELFSATLRDYGKAVLIGETTYGKDVMQRTFILDDGTSVRFTIAKCFTKSGYDFNEIGLEPDIEVKLSKEQKKRYRLLSNDENPVILAAVEWMAKNE